MSGQSAGDARTLPEPSSPFRPGRAQDASAAIRGFVYQAEVTILRWLALDERQILYLECGEDIDLVSPATDTGPAAVVRRLEQVKHRSRPITLLTDEVVLSIMGFVEHVKTNPDHDLRFLFTTTATVSAERPSPFPDRRPALHVWQDLGEGRLTDNARDVAIRELRGLLSRATCPARATEARWSAFCEFVKNSSSGEFEDLVRRTQWLSGRPRLPELQQRVLQAIAGRLGSDDATLISRVHERLLFRALQVLTRLDTAPLTLARLQAELALPELAAGEQAAIMQLVEALKEVNLRLDDVEERVSVLEDLRAKMHEAGVGAPSVSLPIVDNAPPRLVSRLCTRQEEVENVVTLLRSHAWTALVGSYGQGKTHLAALVARNLGLDPFWVRLGQFEDARSAWAYLRAGLSPKAETASPGTVADTLFARAHAHQLVVFDDVPRLDAVDALAELLVALATRCREKGCIIISCSYHRPPPRLVEEPGDDICAVVNVPGLREPDVRQLLGAFGAPEKFRNGPATLAIIGLTRGHPALVAAVARYLSRLKWHFDEGALKALISGEHATGVEAEALLRLARQVTEPACRELLFRVSLAWDPVSAADIARLASLPPALPRPNECLDALRGVWLQEEPDGRFIASQVVRRLGSAELVPEARRGTHQLLAGMLLARGTVDPFEAVRAATHFVAAENHEAAIFVIIEATATILSEPTVQDDFGFLMLYGDDRQLRDSVNPGLRTFLRAQQFELAARLQRQPERFLGSLNAFADECTEGSTVLLASARVLLNVEAVGVEAVLPSLRRLIRWVDTGLDVFRQHTGHPLPADPLMLVWLVAGRVRTEDELMRWLEAVATMTAAQRSRALDNEMARQACGRLLDQLWLEGDRTAFDRQQWESLVASYERIRSAARSHGLRLVDTLAARAQIIITAEYLKDLPGAARVGDATLTDLHSDDPERAVVEEIVGAQYLYGGDWTRALAWLARASGYDKTQFLLQRLHALLEACEAAAHVDIAESLRFAREAVAAAAHTEIADELRFRAHAFLAISAWDAGDRACSAQALDAAAGCLELMPDNERARYLRSWFGHMTSYYYSMLARGTPPAVEGEPYSAPDYRAFRGMDARAAELYEPKREYARCHFLGSILGHVGARARAAYWNSRAYAAATATDKPMAISLTAPAFAAEALSAGDYSRALKVLRSCGRAIHVGQTERKADRDPLRDDLTLSGTFPEFDSVARSDAEHDAARLLFLPLAGHLLRAAPSVEELKRCRDLADEAEKDTPAPALWRAARYVFDIPSPESPSLHQVLKDLSAFDESVSVLAATGRLLIGLHRQATPADTMRSHLGVVEYAEKASAPFGFWNDLAAAIADYWVAQFRNCRAYFSSPASIDHDLEETEGLAPRDRLRAVLRTLVDGLRIHLPQEVRSWFGPAPGP